jgi:hypothetical protein
MKRPRSHVIEDEAAKLLHTMLPAEWIIRRTTKDYGIDYEVEIAEDNIVTGDRLWLQLKGCEKAKRAERLVLNEGGALPQYRFPHIVYDADTALLKYALKCDFPLLLALADLSEKEIYWLPLRDEIEVNLDASRPDWRKQERARVKIDPENRLSQEAERNFYGLKWYARQPARLRAAARLHLYHHEMSYECSFSYEFDEAGVYPQKVLERTIDSAQKYLGKALELDALFGEPGWDAAVLWKARIIDGLKACHELRAQLAHRGEIPFTTTSVLISRMGMAYEALSGCVADVERINEKFVLNSYKVLSRKNGAESPSVAESAATASSTGTCQTRFSTTVLE